MGIWTFSTRHILLFDNICPTPRCLALPSLDRDLCFTFRVLTSYLQFFGALGNHEPVPVNLDPSPDLYTGPAGLNSIQVQF